MFHAYIAPTLILIFGSIASLCVFGIFALAHASAALYISNAEGRPVLLALAGALFASCIACAIVSHFDRVE